MKNKKGFTLIELLAVIVILGILMMAAIPAITRTIAKSRRNTYWQNAKQYVKAATTPFLSGEYEYTVGTGTSATTNPCPLPGKGEYSVIPLTEVELEQGDKEKSSFNSKYKTGGVTSGEPYIVVANIETNQAKADDIQWYFVGIDRAKNGIVELTNINDLKLGVVKTNASTKVDKDFTVAENSNDGNGTLYVIDGGKTLTTTKPSNNIIKLTLKNLCRNANK